MHRVLALVILLAPATVAAQDRRWEIEGYAGGLVAQPASAGTRTLPPAGPPIVTSTPTFPSRATSSWFFGDGTQLLNGALQEFDVAPRATPLDSVLAPIPTARPIAFGLRVRRRMKPRLALELSVDRFATAAVRLAPLSDRVESSVASFGPAFKALFATGPFEPATAVATAGIFEAKYDESAITAAINHDVGRLSGLQPYVTVGAGVVIPTRELLIAQVQGHYTTAIAGEVPIDETDRVELRVSRSTTIAVVAGGGLRRDFSRAWSLRVDARMLVGPDSTRMTLSATPLVASGTPAGFIESFTNPAIQFSNDPSTGRVSSLSGAPLTNVQVFKGGLVARTILGVAIARRF